MKIILISIVIFLTGCEVKHETQFMEKIMKDLDNETATK